MPATLITRKMRSVPAGTLDTVVIIHVRTMSPPAYGTVDYTTNFEGQNVWAMVNTINGQTIFNGVDQDLNVTHEIYVRYDPNINSSKMIEVAPDQYLDIADVENLDQRNTWMKLVCVALGSNTHPVTRR